MKRIITFSITINPIVFTLVGCTLNALDFNAPALFTLPTLWVNAVQIFICARLLSQYSLKEINLDFSTNVKEFHSVCYLFHLTVILTEKRFFNTSVLKSTA